MRFRSPPRFTGARGEAGVAALEFAIMAPLLLVLIVAVVEIGMATRDALRAQSAAASGSYYALRNGFDAAGIADAVVNGTGAAGVSASPAPVQFCGCPAVTGIGETVCTATCADGIKARQYVRVSATITRTSVLDAHLGLPVVLIRQSTVRLP